MYAYPLPRKLLIVNMFRYMITLLCLVIPSLALQYAVTPLATSQITITVPSTTSVSFPIDTRTHNAIVSGVCQMLSDLAGGATAVPAQGAWTSATSGLIKENVTIVSVLADYSEELIKEIQHICAWLAHRMDQEAVLMMVDHQSFLISNR